LGETSSDVVACQVLQGFLVVGPDARAAINVKATVAPGEHIFNDGTNVIVAIVHEAVLRRDRILSFDEIQNQNFVIDAFNKIPDYERRYFEFVDNDFSENDEDEKDVIQNLRRENQMRFAEAID
jgi:hypothetical protein